MVRSYSIGRFFGPWLAFAGLSGLCAGFVYGGLATCFGLIAGLITLANGTDNLVKAMGQIAQAFPEFALAVVVCIIVGIISGFLTGSISALVGGAAGYFWSFFCAIGISILVAPTYFRSLGFEFFFAFALSAFGAILPRELLSQAPFRRAWGESTSQWLRSTWLVQPPQLARFAGILLPVLLYGIGEVIVVLPEFWQHQNYVAKIGNWATWQNSKRLVDGRNFHHSSHRFQCQSNLKQIMLGMRQYAQDYDEYYPPALTDPANGVMVVMQPYLRSTQIFQCPTDFYLYEEGKFESGDFSDYWFNARFYGLSESSVPYFSNTITWGDGNTGAGEANSAYSLRNLPTPFAPAQRHLGGANYVFADGHTKWLRPSAIANTAATSTTVSMVP